MLMFGVLFQLIGNYRPAVGALAVMFVIGAYFLRKLDVVAGIKEAGNNVPSVV